MQHSDIIVVGSGQGGVPLASSFAQDGREVVLFERAAFGGTCVNYGCFPSKAFLASAHAASAARNSDDLGVHSEVTVDFPKVMERVRKTIGQSSEGVEERLEEAGVRLIKEEASFASVNVVEGGDVQITAPIIILNTGKSSAIPPIDGLDQIDFVTYETFWQLEQLPERTLVIGGGYVGVELGQGIARLGSETHIVEQSNRIIRREEEDVSEVLTRRLEQDGVHIHTDSAVDAVKETNDGIRVELSSGETITVDTVLVATGRKPNTKALHADKAGIELDDKGHVQVNDRFQSSNPYVYAIGDVIGQPAFTHVSWEDYRRLRSILKEESDNRSERQRRDRVLGYVFFTEPQVGRVGFTYEQARDAGYEAKSATLPLNSIARAGHTSSDDGFYRMVIDTKTDKILGATLVGPCAGELIHVFMAHMEAGSTWHTLDHSVHIHPTWAEALPVLARKFAQ